LLKIIGGALSKDSGEAKVFGLPPERARLVPKLLGWLPERAPLNPDLTVLEHLRLLARLIGLSKNETAAQIETLAEDLGLKAKLARLCGRLSLGSRRQAALGLALLGPPKLALLDEPTAGLDPEEVLRLRNFLEKLPKSVALIVSSHDLNETARSTIAAAILKDGVLLKPRPWADLGPDPKEGYVMALRQNASL
jgi:ABC-2 type transport system ATP-binding protein